MTAQPAAPIPTTGHLADDLEDALDAAGPSLPRDEHGNAYIADDSQAEWALRRLARLEARADTVRTMTAERVAALERWRDEQVASIDTDGAWYRDALERYHRSIHDADPREWSKKDRKTITLPSGKLTGRTSAPKVEVTDADAVLDWLLANRPLLCSAVVTVHLDELPEGTDNRAGALVAARDALETLVAGPAAALEPLVQIKPPTKTELRTSFAAGPEGRLVDGPADGCPGCNGTGHDQGDTPGCRTCQPTGEHLPGVHLVGGDPSYDAKPEL